MKLLINPFLLRHRNFGILIDEINNGMLVRCYIGGVAQLVRASES